MESVVRALGNSCGCPRLLRPTRPRALTPNGRKTDSLPHLRMPANRDGFPRGGPRGKEAMGGAYDGRKSVGNEGDGHQVPPGHQEGKGQILDELCALTGWHRDHARKALRQSQRRKGPERPRKPRRRQATYGEDVIGPLRTIWAALDGPCGKRLAPVMAEMVEVMERVEELTLTPQQRTHLRSMSPATIDRKLAGERRRLALKGRSRTKPGTLLKHHIPIRTFSEWDEGAPGVLRGRSGGPRRRGRPRGLLP